MQCGAVPVTWLIIRPAYAGPAAWNRLPEHIPCQSTPATIRRHYVQNVFIRWGFEHYLERGTVVMSAVHLCKWTLNRHWWWWWWWWRRLRALGDQITSRLCCASYNGFRCGSASCSRSRRSIVYQSLCGHAPGYLVDNCQLVTDVRARKLRSANTRTLAVNRTCSSVGDRTFAAAAATRVWNSLPPDMRKPELSYGQFRRSLKTLLFGQW